MFEKRSYEPELMDNPKVERKLLQKNLKELDILNRYFGGHSITLQGVKQLISSRYKTYHIADLGCGSGDSMRFLAEWTRKNRIKALFTGVDKNVFAIQYLKKLCNGYPEISGVVMDYNEFLNNRMPVDIYLCSLFCHHLNDTELVNLFQKMKGAKLGFVINDLQRSRLAYYSAWFFTRIFFGTELSRNDGPVSVLRAFTKEELATLLERSGISNYTIKWRWAFRYQIVVKN